MSRHGLASLSMTHAVRSLLAQPPGQYVKGFGAGMRVYRCLDPGRPARVVDAQEILGCGDRGYGTDLGDPVSAPRGAALGTERKKPDLACGFR